MGRRRGSCFCQSLSLISLLLGRAREARNLQADTFDYVASGGDTEFLLDALELAACIAAELGECARAARLAGAAGALRQQAGMPTTSQADVALLERFLAPARSVTAPGVWDAELAAGRALTQEQAPGCCDQPRSARERSARSTRSRRSARAQARPGPGPER